MMEAQGEEDVGLVVTSDVGATCMVANEVMKKGWDRCWPGYHKSGMKGWGNYQPKYYSIRFRAGHMRGKRGYRPEFKGSHIYSPCHYELAYDDGTKNLQKTT